MTTKTELVGRRRLFDAYTYTKLRKNGVKELSVALAHSTGMSLRHNDEPKKKKYEKYSLLHPAERVRGALFPNISR
jgi:hypothetical protein